MSDYGAPDPEHDPAQLVRMIGRLAQMIIELRDEYVANHRDDDLDQLERRLDEMGRLHEQLRRAREARDGAMS